jgi:hypothetical protein
MLDVTRLRVIDAVARHGSVTAAARELHYSSRPSPTTSPGSRPRPARSCCSSALTSSVTRTSSTSSASVGGGPLLLADRDLGIEQS